MTLFIGIAETETNFDEETETMKLFSKLPPLPDLRASNSEKACLSLTLDDGLSIGMEPCVPKDIYDRVVALKASFSEVRIAAQSIAPKNFGSSVLAKVSSPKGKRKPEEDARKQEEIDRQYEMELKERIEKLSRDIISVRKSNLSRKNMTVACPDGLSLVFVHDEQHSACMTRVLHVRQEYLGMLSGLHPCEKNRLKPAMDEKSRSVLMDGQVIKVRAIFIKSFRYSQQQIDIVDFLLNPFFYTLVFMKLYYVIFIFSISTVNVDKGMWSLFYS